MDVHIRQIFISPGHNYFGHHGQPAGKEPTVAVDAISCVAGRGIEGDRFLDFKPDYAGQVTFFSWEVFEEAKRHFARPDLSSGAFRRNVLVSGIDLNAWEGRRFTLQGVEFEGTGEAKPCYWMNQAVAPGAEEWLRGRGGLRARITRGGTLRVGPAEFGLSPASSRASAPA
ncbi:MAG: MOSC domain-containing protein [Cephaloticoccus sp.]